MIRTILRKEWLEYRRDGRVRAIAALIAVLLVVSLSTAWSTHREQSQRVSQARQADQAVFLNQGEKTPHAAAHFGRMAFKPTAPLAVFDSGVVPYLGQVIWLEAHTRSPAMFRPAEDSPDLRRFADLSVAGVLALLLPLLLFILGYSSFASEREHGTLSQILSSGPAMSCLFLGKISAIVGLGLIAALIAILASTLAALLLHSSESILDTIIRSVSLGLAYGLYCLIFAALALWVSARSSHASSALLILLSFWAVSVVILPHMAASIAAHRYPTPDQGAFWADATTAIREARPDRDSEDYRAIERSVLSKALGREVASEEVAKLEINRRALNLEIAEVLGTKTYARVHQSLYATYARQKGLRCLISVLSPTIALRHLSSVLSGTDVTAHQDFALQAEQQRRIIIRKMNEDMLLNGAGQSFAYVTSPELWASIPEFSYKPPPVSSALRAGLGDLMVLLGWCVFASCLSWRAALRQSVL